MAQNSLETLMDLWESDPSFRLRMRRDAEGTIRGAGVSLGEDELAALRSIDWSLSDEELTARATKGAG